MKPMSLSQLKAIKKPRIRGDVFYAPGKMIRLDALVGILRHPRCSREDRNTVADALDILIQLAQHQDGEEAAALQTVLAEHFSTHRPKYPAGLDAWATVVLKNLIEKKT